MPAGRHRQRPFWLRAEGNLFHIAEVGVAAERDPPRRENEAVHVVGAASSQGRQLVGSCPLDRAGVERACQEKAGYSLWVARRRLSRSELDSSLRAFILAGGSNLGLQTGRWLDFDGQRQIPLEVRVTIAAATPLNGVCEIGAMRASPGI
jgi:hypothetical protein